MEALVAAFRSKSRELADVLKVGRTELMDAIPLTMGQEFESFAATLEGDLEVLRLCTARFHSIALGGTAIGTGAAASPAFAPLAVRHLAELSGKPFHLSSNLIESTSSTGSFLLFSGLLRRVAIKLSKICNDLRLLASGPRAGFGELNLPPRAPGSSIMPGKINPIVPEVVSAIAYSVIGADVTVSFASEAGQLQLSAFEPLIVYQVLRSMEMLERGCHALNHECVRGITANREHCAEQVRASIGLAIALVPVCGYAAASKVASKALAEGRAVGDVAVAEGLLTEAEAKKLLCAERLVTNRALSHTPCPDPNTETN
mmetsp:Transcript_8272/g.27521  ORF Transcript_8272/g.27521 Transcript_8272/m.27521 type:complete len:316 (+) Transcript_8272:703-1650(+)